MNTPSLPLRTEVNSPAVLKDNTGPRGRSHRESVIHVVAKTWPRPDRGYGIAVASSLKQYCQVFSRVTFIAVTPDSFPEELGGSYRNVSWKRIAVDKGEPWKRFIRSLAVSCPASILQYASREVTEGLVHHISGRLSGRSGAVVVFEDIPPAYHLPALNRRLPHLRLVLRSHNIIGEVFEGFDKEGGMARRIAWKTELEKLRKFEFSVLNAAHTVWAISSRDAAEYRRRYGRDCDGVVGVCVDPRPYRNLPTGDMRTVIYLGSADLRKGHGLARFIRDVWGSVVRKRTEARLILAGRYTDRFSSPALNIEGRGYVESDREVLSEGMICINPQERGSGIKLKSIIAMLAGKVLISTAKGLEGIEGVHGTHFFRANDMGEMKSLITYVMENEGTAIRVGRMARQLALSLNREDEFARRVRPLLLALKEGGASASS